jgi:hypothetical protein
MERDSMAQRTVKACELRVGDIVLLDRTFPEGGWCRVQGVRNGVSDMHGPGPYTLFVLMGERGEPLQWYFFPDSTLQVQG